MHSEKGIALITTVGLLLLISVMGISSFEWSQAEFGIAVNQSASVESQYLAESGLELALEWFQDPAAFSGEGSFPNGFSGPAVSDFFRKRRTDPRGGWSFLDDHGGSQFTGTPEKPDWLYESKEGEAGLLGVGFEDLGRLAVLKVYAPDRPGGVCTVEATGMSNSGIRRTVTVQVAPGPVPAFHSALQTADGIHHAVPSRVHWGDVRIRSDADLGNSLDALPVKDPSAPVDGSGYGPAGRRDAWADFLAGREVVKPVSAGCIGCDQPFLSLGHPNVYQFQEGNNPAFPPDPWSYGPAKRLARDRGGYFGTDRSGYLYQDGIKDAAHRMTPEEFLSIQSGAARRDFVFVDTVDGNPPDGANLAELVWPVDIISGLFFINADLVLSESGSGRSRTVLSPPLEGTSDPATRRSVLLPDINVDGVLYVSGRLTTEGRPRIFGSVSAGNGFEGAGEPEVWYDADLSSGYYSGLPAAVPQKGTWSIR